MFHFQILNTGSPFKKVIKTLPCNLLSSIAVFLDLDFKFPALTTQGLFKSITQISASNPFFKVPLLILRIFLLDDNGKIFMIFSIINSVSGRGIKTFLSTKNLYFQKYLKQFRPFEYDLAIRFYRENLNRMTINQLFEVVLGKSCCMAGLMGDATPFMNNIPLPILTPADVFAPPTVKVYVFPIPVKLSDISSNTMLVS